MIVDGREVPDGDVVEASVCVVGAGAAAITLALELERAGVRVVMLGGGGWRADRAAQDMYRGIVVDPDSHGALDRYRQRRIGGTTAVWGGRCAPFDPLDFEPREYVPHSGWPLSRAELDPYYARAHEYLELGAYDYTVGGALPGASPEMIPGLRSDAVVTDSLERFSAPTNFGRRYRPALERAQHVAVYLHASCVGLRVDRDGSTVRRVSVATPAGNRFEVVADEVVLAAGGLDATRILLASDDVVPGGLGNHGGNLGRFYGSHIAGTVGVLRLRAPVEEVIVDYERDADGVYCRRRFTLSEGAQREHRIQNIVAWPHHPDVSDPTHGDAVLSAMFLATRFMPHRIPPEFSRQLALERTPYRWLPRHALNLATGAPELARFTWTWMRWRLMARQKLPSVVRISQANTYPLRYQAEQSPNPESRVELLTSTDALGLRRLRVDWRYRDQDVASIARAHRLLARELDRSGCGTLDFDDATIEQRIRAAAGVGSHHLGTTRMSADPADGVVDPACRVHGVSNLYVASSSVFPTSSQAAPTLTIVALAIRIADRIAEAHAAHDEGSPAR